MVRCNVTVREKIFKLNFLWLTCPILIGVRCFVIKYFTLPTDLYFESRLDKNFRAELAVL
jgi:hypothetical protein